MSPTKKDLPPYTDYTFDMFIKSAGKDHAEITQFNEWRRQVLGADMYTFQIPHLGAQRPEVSVQRVSGDRLDLISLSSYNYLGYSYHPEVLAAAKEALDLYGLGATGSPVLNGTFRIHEVLEDKLIEFFGMPGYGVSLFSSGYGANIGVVSAYAHKGDVVVLDRLSHASLVDGAILSQATVKLFKHNDAEHLDRVLSRLDHKNLRILVCTEGVYSADGDTGHVKDIVRVSKKYGATVLVDEAHSLLIAGENGRGVSEEQGVLDEVDMIIATFSKSFGGVGGCLFAREELTNYVNWYARSRMFSCALDPAVTGGLIKALELAGGPDGKVKRERIKANADYLRSLLQGEVDIGNSHSWIIPVIFGDEHLYIPLSDYLQREGVDASLMSFPAVPKNQSRIRLFVTSEHTKAQLERGAEVILKAAEHFGFLLEN
ncbi:MAG: aminotransferase class I/II-fold pyridoxal phosphate-dependent enzyme [Fidelibacterota bacterium]|nr:MAG: aminotransferase class I/II-fold pyridoxal phosphate-dependent enzyme [Candidatus Neomarinimicrobiota bacterium]